MKRRIIETGDGSKTIQIEEWDEQYHSKHGAVQEAYHVFIEKGLIHLGRKHVHILEIGFGTGLNAIITFLEAQKRNLTVAYTGVERFPVKIEEIHQLDYSSNLGGGDLKNVFEKIHRTPWEKEVVLAAHFVLEKQKKDFCEISGSDLFNLVYFDAFGPRVQPELWTEKMFGIMHRILQKEGILVTYCAKGSVRRAMQNVGFRVERLEGPPGKREMLRATKMG